MESDSTSDHKRVKDALKKRNNDLELSYTIFHTESLLKIANTLSYDFDRLHFDERRRTIEHFMTNANFWWLS